jgi:hypothetical protein
LPDSPLPHQSREPLNITVDIEALLHDAAFLPPINFEGEVMLAIERQRSGQSAVFAQALKGLTMLVASFFALSEMLAFVFGLWATSTAL